MSHILPLDYEKYYGGADRDRTDDLLNAIQTLSQLSYSPIIYLEVPVGIEPTYADLQSTT